MKLPITIGNMLLSNVLLSNVLLSNVLFSKVRNHVKLGYIVFANTMGIKRKLRSFFLVDGPQGFSQRFPRSVFSLRNMNDDAGKYPCEKKRFAGRLPINVFLFQFCYILRRHKKVSQILIRINKS